MIVRPAWVTPGRLADAAIEFGEEIGLCRLIGITQRGEREFGGQDVSRIESRVDVLQSNEALEEQTGAGQENERERDLGDDESIAQPVVAPPGSGSAAAFLERFGQVRLTARQPGTRPKMSPVPMAMARVTRSTLPSICTSPRRGMV